MTENLSDILCGLYSLSVFKEIENDGLITALREFLKTDGDSDEAIKRYCEIAAVLYRKNADITEYVRDVVECCPNPVAERLGLKIEVPDEIRKSAERELLILNRIASLTPSVLRSRMKYSGELPGWTAGKINLSEEFSEQMKNIGKRGYGMYTKYRAFRLEGKTLRPIEYPDPVTLSELVGYEREKKLIIDNTKALLNGKPAANILLTGDAGTGKSSTVKAVVNALWQEGLRILELKKEQLHDLPDVLAELNRNPLKFIIFVDDLSFTSNDDNFSALKAMLEGTVSAKSENTAIYATSNRRHLIKESFSDRDGDDVHRNDTMQETVSLSERFGLHITFSRPDKATYLNIVKHLCDEAGVEFDEIGAEKFALTRASRSARAARQYVDSLISAKEN